MTTDGREKRDVGKTGVNEDKKEEDGKRAVRRATTVEVEINAERKVDNMKPAVRGGGCAAGRDMAVRRAGVVGRAGMGARRECWKEKRKADQSRQIKTSVDLDLEIKSATDLTDQKHTICDARRSHQL